MFTQNSYTFSQFECDFFLSLQQSLFIQRYNPLSSFGVECYLAGALVRCKNQQKYVQLLYNSYFPSEAGQAASSCCFMDVLLHNSVTSRSVTFF